MKNVVWQAPFVVCAFLLASCGGGGSSPVTVVPPPPPLPPPPPPPPPSNVVVSGAVSFDLVPLNINTNGLDYNNIQETPVRGVVVEAVDGSGAVLDQTVTDSSGNYALTVSSNTSVRIQVKAQLLQTNGAQWNISVTDNTSNNALYMLAGNLVSSGAADSTRDLRAPSGWGGSSYTGSRSAAPFAILNPLYDTVQAFAAIDPDIALPSVEFRWSVNNNRTSGDATMGEIGSSSYVTRNGVGNVFILGDENADTDEYDRHVVVHEWGHYFEDQLSRSDSTGGSHSLGSRLDPRLAFSEGWGNALSAITTNDPIYRDSLGMQQASGFAFDIESNNNTNTGWFNEASVHSIIYDIFDARADGADNVALGLGPIYDVLVSSAYTSTPFFITLFPFIDQITASQPGDAAALQSLVQAQQIFGSGPDGSGETNTGGIVSSLPIYNTVVANGAAVEICSVDDAGEFNRLGNREFLRLDIPASGTFTLTMTRTSGAPSRDPDFFVFNGGNFVVAGTSAPAESETVTTNLSAGEYVIDAHDFFNTQTDGTSGGDACYAFVVTG